LLLTAIQAALKLDWIYEEPATAPEPVITVGPIVPFPPRHLQDLYQLGSIGYVRGIEAKLDEIAAAEPLHRDTIDDLRSLVRNFELKRYMATLESLRDQPSA
jgi:hypothetical protein